MFDSADAKHKRFWRVGIARHAVFSHSFGGASRIRKVSSEKRGGAKARLPKTSTKFAPRLRARAIWKSKSLKTGGVGALLEVELTKICTTRVRDVFGGWKCFSLQNTRQAQEFVRVPKNVGRRGGFEEGLKGCFLRGRRNDFVFCDVDVWSLRRRIRGRVAN